MELQSISRRWQRRILALELYPHFLHDTFPGCALKLIPRSVFVHYLIGHAELGRTVGV